ncbi:hypothetical protein PFISCL1PPCAC_16148, partial [Pristionchus fissidentatus]
VLLSELVMNSTMDSIADVTVGPLEVAEKPTFWQYLMDREDAFLLFSILGFMLLICCLHSCFSVALSLYKRSLIQDLKREHKYLVEVALPLRFNEVLIDAEFPTLRGLSTNNHSTANLLKSVA